MSESESHLGETISRISGALVRRRRWIVVIACAGALGTLLITSFLPDKYTSEATLLVVQQQVPERYVVSTSTTDMSKGLEAIGDEVLSAVRLLSIAREFHLYKRQASRLSPEEIVARLRHDVIITPLQNNPERRDVNAFKISFTVDQPKLAQAVTARITSLFIEQNLKIRADQAMTTTQFLDEQVKQAQTYLAEQEEHVREYKMTHLGELPEQQQGNLSILAGLQIQIENVSGSLDHAQQQRTYLQSELAQTLRTGQLRSGGGSPNDIEGLTPFEAAKLSLSRLESEKRHLLDSYTPQHPDVVRKEQEIESQRSLLQTLQAEDHARVKTPIPDTDSPLSNSDQEESSGAAQIRIQLETNRLEIQSLTKTQRKLQSDLAQYQARINQTPVREQQLTAILRDYELSKEHYSELLKKLQESQLSMNLEDRQQGQQFRMVDPPSLPVLPSSPKRLRINLEGLAAATGLGLLLAFLVDAKNASFHQEGELKQRFGVSLVIALPELYTIEQQRIRKIRHVLEWASVAALFMLVGLLECSIYWHK